MMDVTPRPLTSAIVVSAVALDPITAALSSTALALGSAHDLHDAPLAGDFTSIKTVLDTQSGTKVSPPEGIPAIYRLVWRRRNGAGVPDSVHVIDHVSAVSIVAAQALAEAAHPALVGDVAAVAETDLDRVIQTFNARAVDEAQRERFAAEADRRDAIAAQHAADAAARKQTHDDAAAAAAELEKGIAAARLERQQRE